MSAAVDDTARVYLDTYLDIKLQLHCSEPLAACIYIMFALLFMVKAFVRVQKSHCNDEALQECQNGFEYNLHRYLLLFVFQPNVLIIFSLPSRMQCAQSETQ